MRFLEVPITDIKPPSHPVRRLISMEALQELVESIKQMGLLHPIVVVETPEGFEIVAGHRRYEAAKLAGLTKVPVHVVELGNGPKERFTLAENVAREEVNPLDLGYYFKYLHDEKGMSYYDIAQMVGKSHTYVRFLIQLAEAPQWLQDMVQREEISWRNAVALLEMPDEDTMKRYADYIARSGATLQQVEQWVKEEKMYQQLRQVEEVREELEPPVEPPPEPLHLCFVCGRWLPLSRMEYVKMCRDCVYELQKRIKELEEGGG
jgi:ParB family chromosome partitioning protein